MLKIYVDAATKGNPGISGAGVVLISDGDYKQLSFPLPILTNHQAEFAALELALKEAIRLELNEQTTFLYTDSAIVSQVLDKNSTRNPDFLPHLKRINNLYHFFPHLLIQWIPESQNKGADNLAKQGLQKAIKQETKKNDSLPK